MSNLFVVFFFFFVCVCVCVCLCVCVCVACVDDMCLLETPSHY